MNKENETIFGCIGVIVATFALMIFSSIFGGWAACKLWEWFIVPVFELPPLTIAQMIGVSMVVSAIRGWRMPNSDDEDIVEKYIRLTLFAIAAPLFSVAFGWIVYQFV